MGWESLIRRARQFAPEVAFAALFTAACASGGGAALAGLPSFLEAATPGMAAQASPGEGLRGVARIALGEGFAESRYSPQVLYPVISNAMPDWLAEAMRAQGTPTLRGTDNPVVMPDAARPVIAICIDDLGEDIAGTDKAMMLPREVALSFLPYAETTPFLAEASAKRGHLILAHVPMQALGHSNPGPMALQTGMAADEITRRLAWHLARVPHLSGVNNHEGSRFTADAASLAPVAQMLAARHLFFFDSRTGPVSQVVPVARAAGLQSAGRDIFLDDVAGEAEVTQQLEALVREAKRTGVAIAIGHPREATMKVLARWLAQDLTRDWGVTLVPLDEAIRLKSAKASAFAAR